MASSTAPAVDRIVVDVKAAARLLGVSEALIYKLIRLRKLAGYRVGRRTLLYRDGLDAYRCQHAIEPTPPIADSIAKPNRRRKSAPVGSPDLPSRRHLR